MARSMTREDIARGGVENLRKVEIEGFFPDGEKGIIHHTRLPASIHLMFMKMEKDKAEISPEQVEAISDKLATCLRDEQGNKLFSNGADMLDCVPFDIIVKLFGAISTQQSGDPGNASSEAATMTQDSTASHTNSLSNSDTSVQTDSLTI